MSFTYTPNPNFDRDLQKMVEEKFRSALSIRCTEHGQTARLEGTQIIGCCEALERKVLEALEGK